MFEPEPSGPDIDPTVAEVLAQAVDPRILRNLHELPLTEELRWEFLDQYFSPAHRLGLNSQTWASPAQLDPEMLLDCYEFYDFELIYLAEQYPELDLFDMDLDGREFFVPQEIVEQRIETFVDVSPETLRASPRYSPEQQAYSMILMFGKGDGPWNEITRVWEADDILLMEIDTDGDITYLLLSRSRDDPFYLAAVCTPFSG